MNVNIFSIFSQEISLLKTEQNDALAIGFFFITAIMPKNNDNNIRLVLYKNFHNFLLFQQYKWKTKKYSTTHTNELVI